MSDEPSEHWLEFIKSLTVYDLAKLRLDFKRTSDKKWLEAIDNEFRKRDKR